MKYEYLDPILREIRTWGSDLKKKWVIDLAVGWTQKMRQATM